LGSTHDIITATTVTTGTSSWAMKLTKTTNSYTPIIAGSTDDTNRQTGDPDFSGYTAVPEEYTKVAYFPSSTDIGSGASGSNLTTTYRAYISQTQPAGTYVGQVKYTLVHPNTASAPTPVYTMQNVANWKNKITTGQEVTVKDARDGKEYTVAKLADGNIWMTQNLDHDVDSSYDYNSTNTDVPSNWSDTLTNTYATGTTTWNSSNTTPESYDPGDLCWNGTIRNDLDGTIANSTVACGNDKHYHIGNYYNWTAAVAMADSSSYTADNTNVNQSICPAGWMLPKGGTTLTGSGSFIYLKNQLSLTSGTSGNIQNSPVYFAYGGGWYGSSVSVGGSGVYWSSVVHDSGVAYILSFDRYGFLFPQSSGERSYGNSVRCVAR
ncbi:hypothetical protein J5491_02810, partial [Candidatus Saccharibacteria bacterium]|nr:hypothetical protein [Candidatus Saccharibacteria bacterium]MBO4813055.1 hypothetical protein [Candidatus Saccharibacteria bacterium]